MDGKQTFETVLIKQDKMDATGIEIPFDVEAVFGGKRVPVRVKINGAENRTTVFRMGGNYRVVIPKVFREAAAIKAGDHIVVTIERDTDERTVAIPADLAQALSAKGLSEAFGTMSFTHRKEHVRAIDEAKAPGTRLRRIAKAVEMVAEKSKKLRPRTAAEYKKC